MNRKIVYVIFFISLISLSIFAKPHHKDNLPNEKDIKYDKILGPDPLKFFTKMGIELTDYQAQTIYNITIKFIEDEKPIKDEIIRIYDNIKNEILKEKPNRDLLKKLISEKKEQEALRTYLRMVRDLDILDILTLQQKEKLKRQKK